MNEIYLGLAIHNHQPVGNYPFVFEQVYHDAYLPLIEALERHPGVRMSLHYSGCLLDWIRDNRPDFVPRVAALVGRGQVEVMTGGYYEPILPMIPDGDKLGQIAKLSQTVRQLFGQAPTGLWLAERVWEPHLPAALARAGVRWTLVDDSHFRRLGMAESDLAGYFITEEQGLPLKVYPGSQFLRYAIPWKTVEEVIEYLRGQASEEPGRIVVLGDDGEKFGSWPTTYAHCWEKGWMDGFFTALEENAGWLKTLPLGEHAERYPARGMVYLPAASYSEMMEWSLPTPARLEFARLAREARDSGREDLLRHLQSGFWRYFLVKYPEANAMHKRMLRVHDKIEQAATRGDASAAREALWSGQCNCPYWHGVFGGLYLRHIRWATHRHLIAAEREAERLLHSDTAWLEVRSEDLDYDGHPEVLIQTADLSLCLHPHLGGMLSEWDLRLHDWNLLNVVSRRREAYHEPLLEAEGAAPGLRQSTGDDTAAVRSIHDEPAAKDGGLATLLAFDPHRRGGFQEQLLPPEATLRDYAASAFARADDFLLGPWQVSVDQAEEEVTVRLERRGRLTLGDQSFPLRLEKAITVLRRGQQVAVRYLVENEGPEVSFLLASEWNLNPIQAPDGDDRIQTLRLGGEERSLTEAGQAENVRRAVALGSAGVGLVAELAQPCTLWHFPVESVSNSEGGLERVNQGASLAFLFHLHLAPGESRELFLTWRTEEYHLLG
jgi:alpha-amylase